MTDPVDRRNLRITGQHRAETSPSLDLGAHAGANGANDVTIIVTQAFGPKGDSIVGLTDVTFDGYPAVTVRVRSGDLDGLVHLSPIHGDGRKRCELDIAPGATCELLCPVSGQPLDFVADVEDGSGARYFAIYLTPQLSSGSLVMVSDLWGHYHSRIIDDFELISQWASKNPE
ncbi:MAG: hypothetical protein KBG15_01725 [Kofleriaceae bacterium]|nr:hypothetical protein [Kofleriaceae bacterium]